MWVRVAPGYVQGWNPLRINLPWSRPLYLLPLRGVPWLSRLRAGIMVVKSRFHQETSITMMTKHLISSVYCWFRVGEGGRFEVLLRDYVLCERWCPVASTPVGQIGWHLQDDFSGLRRRRAPIHASCPWRSPYFYVYRCMFEVLNLTLPLNNFQCAWLRRLNVAPSQLHPIARKWWGLSRFYAFF